MRVISGKYKSRRLKGTPPAGIRPTSDKLKETLFNIIGTRVEGATFLDACAGTGGIGIEAISRGAKFVYFVDQSRKACPIIRENLEVLEVEEGFEILRMDLIKALDLLHTSFDVAFVDPPYERYDLQEACLDRFGRLPLLAAGGLLIIEHSKRHELPNAAGNLRKRIGKFHGPAGHPRG